MVKVFIKHEKQNRSTFASPPVVLDLDPSTWTITAPGTHDRTLKYSIEDIRTEIPAVCIATSVLDASDDLADDLIDLRDNVAYIYNAPVDRNDIPVDDTPYAFTYYRGDYYLLPSTGDLVDVFGPLENQFLAGTVAQVCNDNFTINYEDFYIETVNMTQETWRLASYELLQHCQPIPSEL